MTAIGQFPVAGRTTTRADYETLMTTLNRWIDDRGQRLVTLDDEVGLHGAERDRADVGIAFVVWQAVRERRDALAVIDWPRSERPSPAVAELTYQPLTDNSGTELAASLPEAVRLVDAIVDRVGPTIARSEAATVQQMAAYESIAVDLAAAERLAEELGDQVRAVADMRRRLDRLTTATPDAELAAVDAAALASDVAAARAGLETTAGERAAALAECASAASRLDALRARESDARTAAERCGERIAAPPRLAIPSVDAVALPPSDLASQPWPQARAAATTFVTTVDRLERAFDVVVETYEAPLRERDDLRGLVQAYRDKAASLGIAERDDVDATYRTVKTLLWTAPCDLDTARAAADEYVRLVRGASDPARSGAPTDRTSEKEVP